MAHLKASINFGLVNIPVEIVNAEDRRESVSFHLLDAKDHSRVRYKRVNENTGKEVEWEDIVKGVEVSNGKYVTFTEKELDQFEAESNQGLEIESFVDKEEISPLLFESPYILSPQKGGEKGYRLLQKVLKDTEKLAVVQAILRNREHLSVIYAEGDALILALLRYADEVKNIDEVLPSSLSKVKVSDKEISVAERLVQEMVSTFSPNKYHDHYEQKLKQAIKRKMKGGKTKRSISNVKGTSDKKVVDIMALLSQSLRKGAKPNPKRHKAA